MHPFEPRFSRRKVQHLTISLLALLTIIGYVASGVAAPGYPGRQLVANDDRDKHLLEALKATSALEAVWRQQPQNSEALRNYVRLIRGEIAAMQQSYSASPRSGHAPSAESQQRKIGPPSGPASPSSKVPTPDEIEHLQRALEETHRPTMRSRPTPSLAGVPEEYVRHRLEMANEKVNDLSVSLSQETVDSRTFERTLFELRNILASMGRTRS